MASRSRCVPRLVVALPLVALLWSCQSTGGKPFRYTEQLRQPQKGAPNFVEIGSDCKVTPDTAVVDVKLINRWNPRSQVLWHVADKQDGDRVVIRGVPANSPAIQSLFQREYVIPASPPSRDGGRSDSPDAIRSGSPKDALRLLRNPKAKLVWEYQVDYYRNGQPLCTKDPPDICVQKVGSTGCSG